MLTHWIVESGASSSIRSVSSATFTIVVSRIDMTAPMITTTAIRRTSGEGCRASGLGAERPRHRSTVGRVLLLGAGLGPPGRPRDE